MAFVFISYSKKNSLFALHLRSLLSSEEFAVWMDETNSMPSER